MAVAIFVPALIFQVFCVPNFFLVIFCVIFAFNLLMLIPCIIFQPEFLDLSFGAALAIFLLLEIIRVSPMKATLISHDFLALIIPLNMNNARSYHRSSVDTN